MVVIARFVIIAILALSGSACFPLEAGPRLAHFSEQAPKVGDRAPGFTLYDPDGHTRSLESLAGSKPIVLQLGSHTCPVYRYRRFAMAELYEKYRDRVHFLLVYTLEAHPLGSPSPYAQREWLSAWNRVPHVFIHQHRHWQERLLIARYSKDSLAIDYPYVVDRMDNSVWTQYGSASSPAFIIDRRGRIALRQVWLNPAELDLGLQHLIAAEND